jgi:cation transport regulator ChaB
MNYVQKHPTMPHEHKKDLYKALRHETINNMAKDIHKERDERGLSSSPEKAHRIARRAFHGTLSGARTILFPNTPSF